MNKLLIYNIIAYLKSILEVKKMTLDGILQAYSKCAKYSLNEDVSEYFKYIEEEPFYIPPSFHDVVTDRRISSLNPKFVVFSAPGATGKTSLAKYIANKYDAIYWDLAKVKLGTNSFAGSVLSAVGAPKYSEFIDNLNTGKVVLVIDAFDEAEIISGRKMLSSFILDISNSLSAHQLPTVIFLARTETAQYIASFCVENSIAARHYEIGFFEETSAKEFIQKSITSRNSTPSKPDMDCTNLYYDVVRRNISPEEGVSFLGYAPVLEAIAKHIKTCPNRQKMISELESQTNCVSIIMKIMQDLLDREQQDKVVSGMIERCKDNYPEFDMWDRLYSPQEQLVRVVNYILFNDKSYENYSLDFLPMYLVEEYQALLDSFLPQHPFVRNNFEETTEKGRIDFTGPAFRDYALAKIILDSRNESLADMYFEESQSQSYFPSQIFFDCYTSIADNSVSASHISYVYDSFRAKATALERPYLQCAYIPSEDNYVAVFGMLNEKHESTREDVIIDICINSAPLRFEQMVNVSIDTPNLNLEIGRSGTDARIYNSSVICNNIYWKTRNVSIESYGREGCLFVAHGGFEGDSVNIDIVNDENLRICAPNISNYYKLIRYKYDFDDISELDMTKFIHALRCILVEFRTHGKDMLAKTAERIDNVTVGNSKIKKTVLEYLKDRGIINKPNHLYKINEEKMQEQGIFFTALARMDTELLKCAFADYTKWSASSSCSANK